MGRFHVMCHLHLALLVLAIAQPASAQPLAVGIDLAVLDGAPQPLHLALGQRFRIDQIDIAAVDVRPEDDGLAALRTAPLFDQLDWRGLEQTAADSLSDLAGQPFLREIYRHAQWMIKRHRFELTPLDQHGLPLGMPIQLLSERDSKALPTDDFPIRRAAVFRDISADGYHAEAWLSLRNGAAVSRDSMVFEATPALKTLRLSWEPAGVTLEFPVEVVATPNFAYGLQIGVEDLTPPQPTLAPGDTLRLRLTFRDDAGLPLHGRGALPTYQEFLEGLESGLRYFDFYPAVLFYKDKNKEGVLLASVAGPLEDVRQSYTEVAAEEFQNEVQQVALPKRDGYLCLWRLVPPANILFGGLGDPAIWMTPVSDVLEFPIPIEAKPGNYVATIKARRVYLGESALATSLYNFRVETPRVPAPWLAYRSSTEAGRQVGAYLRDRLAREARLHHPVPEARGRQPSGGDWVGRCADCHTDDFHLGNLLHANGSTESCATCHAPLFFEPDNMLAYRMHYVHFFSERTPLDPVNCQACHVNPESVKRASLLVCLACHEEYHGGAEIAGPYNRCDEDICHPTHHF